MLNVNTFIFTAMAAYGAWALGAATLVGAIGVPLPTSMLLLAAGAFVRQGALDWWAALLLAAVGAIAGDWVSYLLGRFGGTLVTDRWAGAKPWQQARSSFARWGWLSVFFSRFMLTPLALPVNLVAGSTHYTGWRFLSSVVAGELVWVLAFSSLGYLFADQWQALSTALGSASLWLLALAATGVAAAFLARHLWHPQPRPVLA